MRFLLSIIFLLMATFHSFGQKSRVLDLGEKLFFNILNHKPDSSVYDFVKKYFPAFTEPYVQGGWTMYPPGPMPVYLSTVHSLVFQKHPYFNVKFREGRLDLFSKETKDGGPGLTGFHLWFFFDSKQDAETGFKTLCSMFDSLATHKKIFERNGKKIGHYVDSAETDSMNSVEFFLVEDELNEGKHKIFFNLGLMVYAEL